MMPFRPGFVKTISWLERIVELLVVSGCDDVRRDVLPAPDAATDSDWLTSWRFQSGEKSLIGREERPAPQIALRVERQASNAFRECGLFSIAREYYLSTGATEHDFQYESAADIGEEQRNKTGQRPTQSLAPAPSPSIASDQQGSEYQPGDN